MLFLPLPAGGVKTNFILGRKAGAAAAAAAAATALFYLFFLPRRAA